MFDTIYRQMLKKSPTGRTSSHGTHSKKQICNYIIAQKWLRINRKSLRSRVAYDKEIRKRWCLMKEIMVVTRITIGGQQYTAEELGEKKVKEIVRQRMEAAVESMGYERSKK